MCVIVPACVCVCAQNEDFSEEKIRFGIEALYIDCWVRRRIYDAFKEGLESGVRHHLQVRRTACVCVCTSVLEKVIDLFT